MELKKRVVDAGARQPTTPISATAPPGVLFHKETHALGGPVCRSVDEIEHTPPASHCNTISII